MIFVVGTVVLPASFQSSSGIPMTPWADSGPRRTLVVDPVPGIVGVV